MPLIAEDLGVITPAVDRLRERLGLPGMSVLQFLLPDREDPIEVDESRVAYTGTHDNDTSLALVGADDRRRPRLRARGSRASSGSRRRSRAGC